MVFRQLPPCPASKAQHDAFADQQPPIRIHRATIGGRAAGVADGVLSQWGYPNSWMVYNGKSNENG